MNQLTGRQRKLIYLAAMVALAFPIILLGEPSAKTPSGEGENAATETEASGGGKLARLRRDHKLGESNLGKVDPSSATMNLVLVGMRGIAANQLWMQANENQKTKNWAELKLNIESIILLQPHFIKVWEFQGWNLAYNVSAEWDLVEDKYFWIKEGAKFSKRGTERNAQYPELYWWTGIILGDKISNHDAWEYMRKYFNPAGYPKDDPFVGDPEIRRLPGGKIAPDPELNPDGVDNHLVAKSWFKRANDVDLVTPQRRMSRLAFRQRPARAQMAMAEMMMKEGRFFTETDKQTITEAWKIGLREWTDRYADGKPGLGQELFSSLAGKIRLAAESDQELIALTKEDDPPGRFSIELKRRAIDSSRNVVNYKFWKVRAETEALDDTLKAHRLIYEGRRHHRSARLRQAIRNLQAGLDLYAKLIQKYPDLKTRDEAIEEVMIAILAWQDANKLLVNNFPSGQIPKTKPSLFDIWEKHKGNNAEYTRLMQRGFRIE